MLKRVESACIKNKNRKNPISMAEAKMKRAKAVARCSSDLTISVNIATQLNNNSPGNGGNQLDKAYRVKWESEGGSRPVTYQNLLAVGEVRL